MDSRVTQGYHGFLVIKRSCYYDIYMAKLYKHSCKGRKEMHYRFVLPNQVCIAVVAAYLIQAVAFIVVFFLIRQSINLCLYQLGCF